MDIVHSGAYQRVVLGRIDTMNPGISKCPEGIEAEAWNHGISISTRPKREVHGSSFVGRLHSRCCIVEVWAPSDVPQNEKPSPWGSSNVSKDMQRLTNCHNMCHSYPFVMAASPICNRRSGWNSWWPLPKKFDELCVTQMWPKCQWWPVGFASRCCLWKVRCLASHHCDARGNCDFWNQTNTALFIRELYLFPKTWEIVAMFWYK